MTSFSRSCWCGNSDLSPFSPDYSICGQCGTLVSQSGLSDDQTKVANDEQDFYGKNYWFSHQVEEFGFPNIRQRSRQDLPERCLFWLKTLLKFKKPSSTTKVLELGCAHGGFVALMKASGFDALGLEISPWVVEFAKQSFNIPVLLGPLEDQELQEGSFDVICLFDVLEHLPDPVTTMKRVSSLLKPDGICIVQMPCFEGTSYESLQESESKFLGVMQPEHLYLFTKDSTCRLFESLGLSHIKFETPVFPYDMFLVASRQDCVENTDEEIEEVLSLSPQGRLIQALLDKSETLDSFKIQSEEITRNWKKSLDDIGVQSKQIQALAKDKFYLNDIKRILLQKIAHLKHEKSTIELGREELENKIEGISKRLAVSNNNLKEARTSGNQLVQRLGDRNHKIRSLRGRLRDIEHQLSDAQRIIHEREAEIEAMKTSKFWKLRSQWFRLKKFLKNPM